MNYEVCFSSKWNIECYYYQCHYCCCSWGQVSEGFFINLGSRGIFHEEDIWHEFEGSIFPEKFWNWEALKQFLKKYFILEEDKNAKNFMTLQIQGHSKFSHIPKKKFYITLYNLHAYYFTRSSWLRNYFQLAAGIKWEPWFKYCTYHIQMSMLKKKFALPWTTK